jgi:DUF3054 family protein
MGRDVQKISRTTTPAGSELHLSRRGSSVIAASLAADLAAVTIYVLVGRLSHDESVSASGLLSTAWPFLVGIVGGYIGIALTRWPTLSLRGGAVITVKTFVIGLVLRYGVAEDATPFSFVVVTIVVLAVLMLGWRVAALAVLRRDRA